MSTVSISDRSIAVTALYGEAEKIEQAQLAVALKMYKLIAEQVSLSERSAQVAEALSKLMGPFNG
jgi:hypothetical protein